MGGKKTKQSEVKESLPVQDTDHNPVEEKISGLENKLEN